LKDLDRECAKVLRIAFNNRLGFEPTVKVKAITDPAVALALRVRTCEIMAFSKISLAASIDSTLRAPAPASPGAGSPDRDRQIRWRYWQVWQGALR
jgi:hypothetical protein